MNVVFISTWTTNPWTSLQRIWGSDILF